MTLTHYLGWEGIILLNNLDNHTGKGITQVIISDEGCSMDKTCTTLTYVYQEKAVV